MRRFSIFATAIAALALAQLGHGVAQQNLLVGRWQGMLPGGVPFDMTFLPDGRIVERSISAGTVVSYFGEYFIQGNVIALRFRYAIPGRMCATSLNGTLCVPTVVPAPSRTAFAIDRTGALVLIDQSGPTRLQQMP